MQLLLEIQPSASWISASGIVANGIVAQEGLLFLGDDFLPWIVLAFGAAMVAGNLFALIRPPSSDSEDPSRAPVGRALIMISIGAVASIWGLASLLN